MKYELTSEDKKFINKATNIGKEIFYIYEQLANLEIDGKNIDNIEYKSNVSKLRKLVSIENSIYNMEILGRDRLKNLIEYINNIKETENMNDFINTRIINRLIIILDKYNKDPIVYLTSSISDDLESITLLLSNDYINDPKYIEYKNDLIKTKYIRIFLDNRLETKCLDDDLDIPNNVYLSHKLISDYLEFDERFLNTYKMEYLSLFILSQSSVIASLSNKDLDSYIENMKALISKLTLKSALILLDSSLVDKMYHEILKSDDNSNNSNHSKSYIILKEAFEEIEEDRKKISTVSLHRRKI
ncbi:MAG: hypothetical protein PUC23_03700 [bacterium]|nr:hypothetical protein [bacterium]